MLDSLTLEQQMQQLGQRARAAAQTLAHADRASKDRALQAAAQAIRNSQDALLAANAKDMAAAREKGISGAFLDRLELNPKRIESMAAGLDKIADLPDPVGRSLGEWEQPNGLKFKRIAIPLGVIGIIYESRPNVTADAGALCLKSGNCAILRGGSESQHSSRAIAECLRTGLQEAGLPPDSVALVPTQDRAAVGHLLGMREYVDVIVPRGGKGLIARVVADSKIPTFEHLDGNCHTYVHAGADQDKALDVVHNAKLRRTGICGATESLVVDRSIAAEFLPALRDKLEGCEIRGDQEACKLVTEFKPATDEDWDTEYLDAILSVKLVENVDEAIAFVNQHSSGHTEAILTEDASAAERFLNEVDSAIVLHNASTQFADGGEFGFGAEIGIATGRLHARGPVGLEQLTTYKYQVRGSGQARPA